MGAMISGDHIFEGKSVFSGMVCGHATAAPGADVTLSGMIGGNLIVLEGARVVVDGMVGGRIINRGGTVETL